MTMRSMTRDGQVKTFKEMIQGHIDAIGRGEADPLYGLRNLLNEVEKKWPEVWTTNSISNIEASTGKMTVEEENFLVKTLAKGIR